MCRIFFVAGIILFCGTNVSLLGRPLSTIVSTNSDAALRAAIAKGGKVSFSFNGSIILTNAIPINKDVTIDGGTNQIKIGGNGVFQIFLVTNGVTLTVSRLTIADGYLNRPWWSYDVARGAAIYNQGTFIASGCVFSNNIVSGGEVSALVPADANAYGGAIFSSGTLVLNDNLFAINQAIGGLGASGLGGALYIKSGDAYITNCNFRLNQARASTQLGTVGALAAGGGIYLESGTLALDKSQFDANSASGGPSANIDKAGAGLGGGLYLGAGEVALTRSQFQNNLALGGFADWFIGFITPGVGGAGSGGGIYVNRASLSVDQTAIVENIAQAGDARRNVSIRLPGVGAGGGIFNRDGAIRMTNCTIAQNEAIGSGTTTPSANHLSGNASGAAIYNDAQFEIEFSTVARNTNKFGTNGLTGGKLGEGIFNTGQLTIANSIVAYHPNGNFQGIIIDPGHNISSDSSGHFTSSSENMDPLLGALGNNGGLTLSMALLEGSPAIDAAATAGPAIDQIGNPRPRGSGSDIGAFEKSSTASEISGVFLQKGDSRTAQTGSAGLIVPSR